MDICIECFIETHISQPKKKIMTKFSGYDPWGIPSTFMMSDMGVNKAYNISYNSHVTKYSPLIG